MSFTFSFSSRNFRSHRLLLKSASGDEIELNVHPLILSHRSPFFDKVVFPFEDELFSFNSGDEKSTLSFPSTPREKKPTGPQPEEREGKIILTVPDVWATADVINSFYGENTNTGSLPKWLREIKLAQAKDFLLIEKMNIEVFLQEIPKTALDFDKYLSLALDENNPLVAENKESFLEKFSQKVGDISTYFGADLFQVIKTIEEKKVFSPALVKNLVGGIAFEDVAHFESLVGILELCPKEEAGLLKDIWEDLDFAIGGKYQEVRQDRRLRYEKLGFSKSKYESPTNIVGMFSDRVLSFALRQESPAIIHGASVSASCFALHQDKIILGTVSGILSCDQKGKEVLIHRTSNENIRSCKINKDIIYLIKPNSVLAFDLKKGIKIEEKAFTGNCCRDVDDKGCLYSIVNNTIIKQKISSPVIKDFTLTYHSYCYDKNLKASNGGKFLVIYSNRTIYLINTFTYARKSASKDLDPGKIFFSCCEKYLVVTSNFRTYIYRTDLSDLTVYKEQSGVAIASAGKRKLLAVLEERKISIWDFEGVCLFKFDVSFGVKAKLQGVFSDDGSLLAVSSEDKLTNVYHISTGELLFSKEINLKDIKFY